VAIICGYSAANQKRKVRPELQSTVPAKFLEVGKLRGHPQSRLFSVLGIHPREALTWLQLEEI
jgi:hypothetical protein